MTEPLPVLFVDDEPRVLEALQRMLFDAPEHWEVEVAESGIAALAKLEAGPFAVVVSDMRMPTMDGAALLALVKERHPDVMRVVLSGQTDEGAARRAIRVAHRFLAKPCQASTLIEVIGRAERIRTTLADGELRAAIADVASLPTPPATYMELTQLLCNEDVALSALVNVVRRDASLSVNVLHVANSAFFARSAPPIADLHQAVVRIGPRLLASLALTDGVFQRGDDDPGLVATQARAVARGELAARLVRDPELRDEAFTAGLLADLGLLVVQGSGGDRARETHAKVGAYLLYLWGLPQRIVDAVLTHHTPRDIPRSGALVAAAVYAADAMLDGEVLDPDLVAAYELPIEERGRAA